MSKGILAEEYSEAGENRIAKQWPRFQSFVQRVLLVCGLVSLGRTAEMNRPHQKEGHLLHNVAPGQNLLDMWILCTHQP